MIVVFLDGSDGTATDEFDNALAMNDLAQNLASSDEDSDFNPPPRRYLGRQAKEPTKESSKKKKKKLTTEEKRERKISKLTPGQVR